MLDTILGYALVCLGLFILGTPITMALLDTDSVREGALLTIVMGVTGIIIVGFLILVAFIIETGLQLIGAR